jgi:hypothetical protein
MYIDYNMAEIALMVCAFSSLMSSVGGGFYMFKKEQEKTAKKEFIAEKKAAPYVTMFMECDYKDEIEMKIGEGDDFEEADVEITTGFKSIIVPKGFKAVTYSEVDKGGTKITLGGPSDQKCTNIKSMVVTKV